MGHISSRSDPGAEISGIRESDTGISYIYMRQSGTMIRDIWMDPLSRMGISPQTHDSITTQKYDSFIVDQTVHMILHVISSLGLSDIDVFPKITTKILKRKSILTSRRVSSLTHRSVLGGKGRDLWWKV